ncbi:MAG: crotonase/enoyl-CoA hydratase family protein [Acidimicrobiales bacterium]|jgi:enoyl-CoA hydratase|nr:crotonase/enoyl-CoA hydratase family protein [Acidimicrobiales bacterium]MDP6901787.1 crotonase/enoyl-CoA hydratase family protein [Acidimicrobiales bacterium]
MTVRIEKSGPVWTVIHSRAEARNAMDSASAEALYNAFLEFENDDGASVAVFWGEGGSFCAGWDLKQAASLEEPNPLSDLAIPLDGGDHGNGSDIPMGAMGPSRLELNKPVIAAVAGPAVAGGMELALWCDFRVMEESAYLGVYCRRWGIPLIDGGTVRLPRLVGEGRALELILTGRQVMADECERLGLCEYVVPEGQSRGKAEELAQQIAAFPQLCARADRRSVRNQHGLPIRDALAQEWHNSRSVLEAEGITGASRFSSGEGRHGKFDGS